jgi:predicted HicB family RNase H-like nuclease
MIRFTLRLPSRLHAKLIRLAQRDGRSLNSMIVRLLERLTQEAAQDTK